MLAKSVGAMLSAPDAFEVFVDEPTKSRTHVRIHPRVVVATRDVLSRTEARIEITGTGRFILRLDGVLSLEEIHDHDDEVVLEILSEFCAIAENYLAGNGTFSTRVTRWGTTHLSIALAGGEDQYLLVGRLPQHSSFEAR